MRFLLLTLTSLFLLVSCAPRYSYRVPPERGDGWRTGSLEEAGLEKSKLAELVHRILRRRYQNIHGLLIVKEGRLVFEQYFGGYRFDYTDDHLRGEFVDYDADTLHNLMSITKAVTAAVVGIAVDQGLIRSEQEPVFPFLPRYSHLAEDGKARIRIAHLLTMSSGLKWNEFDVPLTSTENDLIRLFIVGDPLQFILAKELVHEPGSYWYYSGGDVNLLGAVFKEATGYPLDEFCVEHLFGPLGIERYEWKRIKPDLVYASGELSLRPRDLAKFGSLYLNGGRWNGRQIISGDWIEKSLRAHISTGGRTDQGESYGYQWWQKSYRYDSRSIEAMSRTGWGGQALILFPSIGMIAVLTGGNYLGTNPVDEIVSRYLLPSAR